MNHALSGYTYPGNVRELRNLIERAVILTQSGRLELKHLPQRLLGPGRDEASDLAPSRAMVSGADSLQEVEARMIRQAMSRAGNVRTRAAKLLGISRFQLLRRMRKFRMNAQPGQS